MRGQRPEKIRRIPCIGEANTNKPLQRITIDKKARISLKSKN